MPWMYELREDREREIIACKWDRQSVCFVLLLFRFSGGSSWIGWCTIAVLVLLSLPINHCVHIYFVFAALDVVHLCMCLYVCVCFFLSFSIKHFVTLCLTIKIWIERMPNCYVLAYFIVKPTQKQMHTKTHQSPEYIYHMVLFSDATMSMRVRQSFGICCVLSYEHEFCYLFFSLFHSPIFSFCASVDILRFYFNYVNKFD